jgi:hypothetical protein
MTITKSNWRSNITINKIKDISIDSVSIAEPSPGEEICATNSGVNSGEEFTLVYEVSGSDKKPTTISFRYAELISSFNSFSGRWFKDTKIHNPQEKYQICRSVFILWGMLKNDSSQKNVKALNEEYGSANVRIVLNALRGNKRDVRVVKKYLGFLFFIRIARDGNNNQAPANTLIALDVRTMSRDDWGANDQWKEHQITKDFGLKSLDDFWKLLNAAGLAYQWSKSTDKDHCKYDPTKQLVA